jgi:hypothetical protein
MLLFYRNRRGGGDDVVYQFHIDNNDDAREDLTFQFLFGHKFVNGTGASVTVGGLEVPIALVAFGQIKFVSNPETLNQREPEQSRVLLGAPAERRQVRQQHRRRPIPVADERREPHAIRQAGGQRRQQGVLAARSSR